MCEQSYSESGACSYLRGCNEFSLIVSDRDRLAGVVAGMEEQGQRNIDALRRVEAENARLTEDLERQSPYRIRLHNDLLGSQALVEEVLADNARLRGALKAVEWVPVPRQTPHDAGWRHCPICKWPSMGCEHSPSCVIGNALKEVG